MHTCGPMRALFLVPALLVAGSDLSEACPSAVAPNDVGTDTDPSTSASCMQQIDFSLARRVFEVTHVVGAGGVTRSGLGSVASAFAALELSYGLQFGSDPDQPSYEIEVSGGAALHHSEGTNGATGLVTQAALRLGPAQLIESVIDSGRGNFAPFPLTLEISHAGELAARPRMSARPELARSLYHRERVEFASRILRVEGSGTKAQDTAPGLTEQRKPTAWAIDVIPLYAGLDVALQDSTRIDATVGGSLLGVVEHSMGAKIDLLLLEHRRIDLAMYGTTNIDTVWMLKLEGTDPHTGSQYQLGWGEVIVTDELEELAPFVDPESGSLSIGGAGWFSKQRAWGGFGMQYKREPYVAMNGEAGLEDRFSAEVYVPRALNLIARTFVARTKRMVADVERNDTTAGVELDATYTRGGWSTKAGVEIGRTYYTALDNTLPSSAGFGAAFDLTVQHTGSRSWTK